MRFKFGAERIASLVLDGQVKKSENSEISEISEIKIFKSEFSILALGQNWKPRNQKTPKNFSEISEFCDFFEFSICHFFIFQKK